MRSSDYYDFHDRDTPVYGGMQDNLEYCAERDREKLDWTPFLSFPITKSCNFHCVYCGFGGEATSASRAAADLSLIHELATIGIRNGVRKFRLTGGEPLLHRDIERIFDYFGETGRFTLVNSNGSLILNKRAMLDRASSNIRFAVSLDTLVESKLPAISGVDCLADVLSGIEYLKQRDLLLRVNMVVGRHNIDEVDSVIGFCRQVGCDLKILDIVSVPVPFGERGSQYAEISSLEQRLAAESDGVYSHEYTRGFGTPCLKYKFGDSFVTVKNSVKGSHYDRRAKGLCDGCAYFPCHEGLYDLFALPDGRLCSCRWTEAQMFADPDAQMRYLIDAFRSARYVPKLTNQDMAVRTDLMSRGNPRP